MTVPPDVRLRLFDATSGHPNFTSAIAKRALGAANDGQRNVLCANDVDVAVVEIAARDDMFRTSWFDPSILDDAERGAAIDLAYTLGEPRSWMPLADVLARMGDGGKDRLFHLEQTYVLETKLGATRGVRIRGAVLEQYLRGQHGMVLPPSPEKSRLQVGVFVDVENVIRAAKDPEELAEALGRFAGRFGNVCVRVTTGTEGSLARAGWTKQRVQSAFDAAGWQFIPPPRALENKENIADHILVPVITQDAEQFNLAEVVVVSGDHSFIPAVNALLDHSEAVISASGRRVHAVSMVTRNEDGRSPRHAEWMPLASRRHDICQVLGEERPDLVLWDMESILIDPQAADPATATGWTEL